MRNSTDAIWHEMSRVAQRHGRRLNVDSEDLAQSLATVFLAQTRPVNDPGPWLERVARNLAVQAWRRGRREPPAPSPQSEVATEPTVVERLAAEEERRALEAACGALRSDERTLLACRFGETAVDASQKSPQSASERTRLRRVLLRLRQELAQLRALWAPGPWAGSGQGLAALCVAGQVAVVAFVGGDLGAGRLGSAGPRGADLRAASGAEHAPRQSALLLHDPPQAVGVLAGSPQGVSAGSGRRLLAAAPRPARASSSPNAADSAPRSEAAAPARHIEFDNDQVEGELQRPDGTVVRGRVDEKKPSLIELRNDFVPELLKGLEDLG